MGDGMVQIKFLLRERGKMESHFFLKMLESLFHVY